MRGVRGSVRKKGGREGGRKKGGRDDNGETVRGNRIHDTYNIHIC